MDPKESNPTDHPFYQLKIAAWGGKPRRSIYAVADNGCYIFQGAANSKGYPCRGAMLVHRMAWEAINGAIPDGHEIHHRCGTKMCIRIDHLACVTKAEHAALEGRPLKLAEADIPEILSMLDQGLTRAEVAARFNISLSHVSGVRNGRVWKKAVRAYYGPHSIREAVAGRSPTRPSRIRRRRVYR